MATSYPAYGAPPQALYPPASSYNSSVNTFNQSYNQPIGSDARLVRTPSPTPSEQEELLANGFNMKKYLDWRFWVRRQWLWYYVIGGIILILTILIAVYDKQIIKWLTPAANWMKNLKFGWLIPIAIFFVISFPPLFGHEIVAILCGVVWGLWIGFAIVAAGTFLGELGNYYAFKYCCRARGEKLERDNLQYACLARVVREGGFLVVLICRLSVLPGHFTTAIFSTCGVGVITFSVAAILSLPKQLITVYIGVVLEQSGEGTETSRQKLISDGVLVATIAVTAGAMWYLSRKIGLVKPDVIYARRKARQGKAANTNFSPYAVNNASNDSAVFNPNGSDTNIPLNPSDQPYGHQQWDSNGHAIGYAGDPRLNVYAPEPQRAHQVPTFRDESQGVYSSSNSQHDNSGIGTTYPKGLTEALGRSPIRQESGESGNSGTPPQRRDTFELPRVASPEAEYENPFEPSTAAYVPPSEPPPPFPTAVPHLPPPTQTPTQTPTSYGAYPTPPQPRAIRDSALPNPFDDAAAPDDLHTGHVHQATDDSFFANDGHSRLATDEPSSLR